MHWEEGWTSGPSASCLRRWVYAAEMPRKRWGLVLVADGRGWGGKRQGRWQEEEEVWAVGLELVPLERVCVLHFTYISIVAFYKCNHVKKYTPEQFVPQLWELVQSAVGSRQKKNIWAGWAEVVQLECLTWFFTQPLLQSCFTNTYVRKKYTAKKFVQCLGSWQKVMLTLLLEGNPFHEIPCCTKAILSVDKLHFNIYCQQSRFTNTTAWKWCAVK